MKRKVFLTVMLSSAMILFTYGQQKNGFEIKNGVNINNAFSGLRGESRNSFTRADIEFIANLGNDHVRIPTYENQLFDENGQKIPRAFALLHEILGWCDEFKLRAIVELHTLRSHSFVGTRDNERPFFTDPKAQEQFYEFWRKISGELNKYAVDKVAYEPLNEPVALDPETWNVILNRYIEVIRQLEPNRTILLPPNEWNRFHTAKYLRIPENDPNLIISFHYYLPMLLTHYGATWTDEDGLADIKVPVHYPGQMISDADLTLVTNKNITTLGKMVYNIDALEKEIMQVIEVGKKYNIPVNCGEYGCINTAPEEDRIRWYKDLHTLFVRHGISQTSWDYKSNNFGIVNSAGEPQTKIINAILGK